MSQRVIIPTDGARRRLPLLKMPKLALESRGGSVCRRSSRPDRRACLGRVTELNQSIEVQIPGSTPMVFPVVETTQYWLGWPFGQFPHADRAHGAGNIIRWLWVADGSMAVTKWKVPSDRGPTRRSPAPLSTEPPWVAGFAGSTQVMSRVVQLNATDLTRPPRRLISYCRCTNSN